MKYCKGCEHYMPKARYQFEMKNPKMKECRNSAICNRIEKLVEKENKQLCMFK